MTSRGNMPSNKRNIIITSRTRNFMHVKPVKYELKKNNKTPTRVALEYAKTFMYTMRIFISYILRSMICGLTDNDVSPDSETNDFNRQIT